MLLSVCNYGSGYGWSTNFDIYNKDKQKKKQGRDEGSATTNKLEFPMKNVRIHAVGYDEVYDLLYVSSSDNKLTLFNTDNRSVCKNYM